MSLAGVTHLATAPVFTARDLEALTWMAPALVSNSDERSMRVTIISI
jgi:hypothetical protein